MKSGSRKSCAAHARIGWGLVLALGCGEPPAAAPSDAHAGQPRCASCHAREYEGVDRPPHAGIKPLECGVCHDTTRWHPSTLHHTWALTGAHEKADCAFCHGQFPGTFRGTANTCVGCHRADYERARFPGHEHFPLTCADCHDTQAFKPATYRPPAAEPEERGASASHEAAHPSTSHPELVHKPRRKAPSHKGNQDGTAATVTPAAPTAPPSPAPEPAPAEAPKPAPRPDVTSGATRRR